MEESLAMILYRHSYISVEDMARTSIEEFIGWPGFRNDLLTQVHQKAVAFCEGEVPPSSEDEEVEEENIDEV